MPDDEHDDDLDDASLTPDEQFRRVRSVANKAKRYERDAAEAKRELAFYKAGIPLDNPMTSYFVQGYAGEMTADAIRSEAEKVGILAPQAVETVPVEEADAHQRMMGASAGANAPDRQAEFERLMAETSDPVQIHALMVKYQGWTPLDKS